MCLLLCYLMDLADAGTDKRMALAKKRMEMKASSSVLPAETQPCLWCHNHPQQCCRASVRHYHMLDMVEQTVLLLDSPALSAVQLVRARAELSSTNYVYLSRFPHLSSLGGVQDETYTECLLPESQQSRFPIGCHRRPRFW